MVDGAPIRIFLVGFPRSGTTLLQSLFAAHPEVLSLPETFFFVHAAPSGYRWRLLGRAHPQARARLRELERHGIEVPAPALRETLPIATAGPTVRRFVKSLDVAASAHDKRAWVEKTPSHLHYMAVIERYMPDAKFLHMIRDGMPAIASLHAVTHAHPEPWGGRRALDVCIARWKSDIQRSYACVEKANHLFVSYERLVADPSAVLSSLTQSLRLSSDSGSIEAMVAGYADASLGVVSVEPWKSTVGAPIINRNGARAAQMFSAEERQRIAQMIAPEKQLLTAIPFR